MPISQAWNISDYYDGLFFGGNCKLYYQIISSDQVTPLSEWKEIDFQVLGRNPDAVTCQQTIIANSGSIYYAYAVAKWETQDSSVHPYFNQFANGLSNGSSGAHGTRGFPFHSSSEGNGWGLFQLDTSSELAVSTQMCWSWIANMNGFFSEYTQELAEANQYFDSVRAKYPAQFEEPIFTVSGKHASGRDLLGLTLYNGTQGRGKSTMFSFNPSARSGNRWTMNLPNAIRQNQSYASLVFKNL